MVDHVKSAGKINRHYRCEFCALIHYFFQMDEEETINEMKPIKNEIIYSEVLRHNNDDQGNYDGMIFVIFSFIILYRQYRYLFSKIKWLRNNCCAFSHWSIHFSS